MIIKGRIRKACNANKHPAAFLSFVLVLTCLAYPVSAQEDVTIAVDPRSSFWQASAADDTRAPVIIDLAAAGFLEGDLLALNYEVPLPGFDFGFNGACNPCSVETGPPGFCPFFSPFPPSACPQVIANIIALFSGSSTLLAETNPLRVPDAIVVRSIFNDRRGGFYLTGFPFPKALSVQIPRGATHLFVAVADSGWGDNCVPGNRDVQHPRGFITVTASLFLDPCDKVRICHVPPENPENFRAVCMPENAVIEHFSHGDFCGLCGF